MHQLRHATAASPRRPLRHAVVLGGSIGGLLAARALADHFEHVALIERDALDPGPEARKGVPQANHLHALLARGRMIADAMLPGLSEELVAAGATRLNAGRDLTWHHSGRWRVRHESSLNILSQSRPLLESRIRERVRALPNVAVLDGTRVVGLRRDRDGITGVRLARPGSARSGEIGADLVVDAMGRGSSVPLWLDELGFAAPETELVGARVSYATCTFRRTDREADRRALVITGRPARRSGLMFPIEDGRWLVTLPSFFDELMPQDHAAFLEHARSLVVPDLYDRIRSCEPLTEIRRHRFIGSLRRRYERLRRPAEGLIAVGDALCSFNPVYGQGMTVAAIEAEALGETLAAAHDAGGLGADFAARWFRVAKPRVDAAWNAVLLEDFRAPELERRTPLRLRPMQWYMDRVQRATHRSPFATERFYRVMNFLEPASTLFDARMVAEVLLPLRSAAARPQTSDPVVRAGPQPARAG